MFQVCNFFNNSVLNFLPAQGDFWSFVLCEYPAVNAYHSCHVLSCQTTPSGNGYILYSAYLLRLKAEKAASAHLTLQQRIDRLAVCVSLHADGLHSRYSILFNSC